MATDATQLAQVDETMPTGPALVTGAAGFIGSWVCQRLLDSGREVLGLDSFHEYYERARKERHLADVRAVHDGGFEFREGDIRDVDSLTSWLAERRPASVIHLAARAGVRPSIADPFGYADFNVTGTQAVLSAAAASGVERMVIASSSSVYGNNEKTPFAETDAVDEPISPYAATKKACEVIAHAHRHLTGMPTACLRFFTVFGPRQRPDLAISLFLGKVSRGEPIRVFGDGSMSRDFTFIDDIVRGVLAAEARIPSHGYRVWNLGSDRPTALRDLIAAIERAAGREAVIDRQAVPPGDVDRTWADLTRSRAELGYAPRASLDEGLRAQLEWMRAAGYAD